MTTPNLGSATVEILPDLRGFRSHLEREVNGSLGPSAFTGVDKAAGTAGTRAGTTFGSRLQSSTRGLGSKIGGSIAGQLSLALAGAAVVKGLDFAIDRASDLNETLSKTQQIFGDKASNPVVAFADDAAEAIGQSKIQALDAASTFAIFGKGAGLAGRDLSDFATDFTGLASDLASFNNTSPEEAITAIGSALRGEAEPIRQYGVLLDDASLRQSALRLGLIRTTKEALTPQQRVLAAQAEIYRQTSDAQGDFARTSDGLANQQRILKAKLDDAASSIGQKLLPVVLDVVAFLNERAVPAVEDFLQALDGTADSTGGAAQAGLALGDVFRDDVLPVLTELGEVARNVGGFLADHRDTVILLAKAYVAFRVAAVGLRVVEGVAGSVSRMSLAMAGGSTAAGRLAGSTSAVSARIAGGAAGGPAGLALTAALTIGALAFQHFSGKADDTAAAVKDLRTSLDETTGAVTLNTRETLAASLADSGLAKGLDEAGVSSRDYTSAALGNEAANVRVRDSLEEARRTLRLSDDAYRVIVGALDAYQGGLDKARDAQGRLNSIMDIGKGDIRKYRREIQDAAESLVEFADKNAGAASGLQKAADKAAKAGESVVDALVDAVNRNTERFARSMENLGAAGAAGFARGNELTLDVRASTPRRAAGGILTRPELFLGGEDGPEVVVPLTRPRRARQLAEQSGLLEILARGDGAPGRGDLHFHLPSGDPAAIAAAVSNRQAALSGVGR